MAAGDQPDIEARVRRIEVMVAQLETAGEAKEEALRIQAAEYERRLQSLNNENARIAAVLAHSVSQDRFDDYVKSERAREEELSKTNKQAIDLALERVNEKFDDFVRKYELRQKEVDAFLTTNAALAASQQKTFTRNVAVATLVLALVVILINILTSL